MSTKSAELDGKYPHVDCEIFDNIYNVTDGIAEHDDLWASDSVKEWNANIRDKTDQRPVHFTGQMQCFCANQIALDPKNIKNEYHTQDSRGNKHQDSGTKICQLYADD